MSIQTETPGRTLVRGTSRKRAQAKRDLVSHVAAYVIVSASFIGIWILTGGYFWPAWVIGLWGAGLLINARDVFSRR